MRSLWAYRSALGPASAVLSFAVALAQSTRPSCCMHIPTRCDTPSGIVLEDNVEHRTHCTDERCARCCFWNSIHGKVRKGRRTTFLADSTLAWKNAFTFQGEASVQTWLCERPPMFGGPWGYGCYVCNLAMQNLTGGFAKVEIARVQKIACVRHAKSKEHIASLENICKRFAQPDDEDEKMAVHGISVAVPRLDRWVHAASVIERFDSFSDFKRSISAGELGSVMQSGASKNDDSRHLCKQLIITLAEPLRWRDAEVLRNATASSIAIDERDSVLLVYARTYCRRTQELYDCLLGLARGFGTEPRHCMAAIQHVVDKAFTFTKGKLAHRKKVDGERVTIEGESVVDESGRQKFIESVRSAVADGGPTEQRALYDSSPASVEPAYAANPYFKNLDDICRDRAHKWRTVQKGFWNGVGDDVKNFLDSLVIGEHSFARMVQTSLKYRLAFKAAQKDRMSADSAECFCKIVENLSHKEARFDSRSEPLFRFFSLIGVAIDTMVQLSNEGDDSDRRRCSRLLAKFGGLAGYDNLVSAAVVSDCMMVTQKFINLSQVASDDVSLVQSEAIECLQTLKSLLVDGSIWLQEAEGTLTHAALQACKQKDIFLDRVVGQEIILMAWLAPGTLQRSAPVKRAKAFYDLFEAYVNSHFPNHDVQAYWSAFNLGSIMSHADRAESIRQLCIRFGKDWDVVKRALFGMATGELASKGSVWSRALHYHTRRVDPDVKKATLLVPPVVEGRLREFGIPRNRFGLRLPTQRNVKAWLAVLRDLRRLAEEPAYKPLVELTELYVSRLSQTDSIERWFGIIAKLELRQRCKKIGVDALTASLKMRVQDVSGMMPPGMAFDPRRLLVRDSSSKNVYGLSVLWLATPYALICQRIFLERYGARSLRCRMVRTQTATEIVASRGMTKVSLSLGKLGHGASIKAKKRKHDAAIKLAVVARAIGATEGPLGSVEALDEIEPLIFFGQSASGAASSTSLPSTLAGMRACEDALAKDIIDEKGANGYEQEKSKKDKKERKKEKKKTRQIRKTRKIKKRRRHG